MRLTKYQKARLLEFEWDIIDNDTDNTCWLQLNKDDGRVFDDACKLLECDDDTKSLKILIVAHSVNKTQLYK